MRVSAPFLFTRFSMQKLTFIANTISAVTETVYDGKPYLIAPVVAIREGVLNNILYLSEEFGRYFESWNGRPVPLGHPKRNGEYVSANSPDIWANEVPGYFWEVMVEGDRLKGDIWIELEKAEKIGKPALDVVERLRAGDAIEVSTGLYADIEETAGTWNGKAYEGIARNIRPDHLALLPNEIGACSWDDGCGTPRVNQKGVGMGNELTANEFTLSDRAALVRRAFWQSVYDATPGSPEWGDWDVLSVFEATVVAKNWDTMTHAAFPYTLTEAGQVVLGAPTAVEVVYRAKDGGAEVVIANAEATSEAKNQKRSLFNRFWQTLRAGKVEGVTVQEEEQGVNKCDRVAALVANKQCKFSKEVLEKWSETDLETLQQSLVANGEAVVAPAAVVPPVMTNAVAAVQLPPEVTQFAAMIQSIGGVGALGAALQSITANADRERSELVAEIVANSTMTEDDLKPMNVAALRKFAENLQTRDYSGAAGIFRTNNGDDEEYVMQMPVAWPVAGEGK